MLKGLLIGLENQINHFDINYSLDELKSLAKELDIIEVGRITQKALPNPSTYVGKGKLEQIKLYLSLNDVDVCVFDDELSPLQMKTLSEELNVDILDRTALILNIFDSHAHTHEAKLEIELARLRYRLPRLQSLRDGFDRQKGGVKNKGKGETQLELDRRHIVSKISQIEHELLDLEKMKTNQILNRKKKNIKSVALVGYTNAGKSTTMNTIIEYTSKDLDKKVYAKNQLFATLNTSVRNIEYDGVSFSLVDTVGFVSKLPTTLVHSFKQTLKEVTEADLIILVLDTSSKYASYQFNVTIDILENLHALDKKILLLLNKSDLTEEPVGIPYDYLTFSNMTKYHVKELLEYIKKFIISNYENMILSIPYADQREVNFLIEHANIVSKIYQENSIEIEAFVPKEYVFRFLKYEKNGLIA